MANTSEEKLLYGGESAKNRFAFARYLHDVQRGKSLLQLQAADADATPEIRSHWSPRSFTAVQTSAGLFDAVVCNIAYHFHKHGQKYGDIHKMTQQALATYRMHRGSAVVRKSDGLLKMPDGSLFEPDGRIVTFVG